MTIPASYWGFSKSFRMLGQGGTPSIIFSLMVDLAFTFLSCEEQRGGDGGDESEEEDSKGG